MTRFAIEHPLNLQDIRDLFDPVFNFGFHGSHRFERKCDVIKNGQVRIERVKLEHKRNVPIGGR